MSDRAVRPAERVVRPTSRGFLFLDSHPAGCERVVTDLRARVPAPATAPPRRRPVVLVIGSSAGYGLASTVVGLVRYGVTGVGVCSEKPATPRRTATAGWYRTAATARVAGDAMTFVNGDAFADATKTEVLDLLAERYGPVDHLVYSVAAPRRVDPDGVLHTSVLKPIGAELRTPTLQFGPDGGITLSEVEVPPATPEEIAGTVAVMGGADWERWVEALRSRGLVADGFTTVALSYVGSPLTAGIYRSGTIGMAKEDLEATARRLHSALRPAGGRAATAVAGAAVTQAATAIPGIALYTGLLKGVLGREFRTPLQQATELWEHLSGERPFGTDAEGRIRLDAWELADPVREAVTRRWHALTAATVPQLADLRWFVRELRALYGFDVPGIDYGRPVRTEVPWPEAPGR